MIRQLLILSGLAAVCAVINHSAHYMIIAMFWWTDKYRPVAIPNYDAVGGVSYYVMLLVVQIAVVAVPAFLFISGFFIAAMTGRNHDRVGWKAVFSRIKFLIWPYLLWSLIVILLAILLEGETYTLRELAWALISGGATAAFYYIPLLILFYLLSPFISPIAKRRPWLLLAIAAVLLGLAVVARYAFFLEWPVGRLDALLVYFRNWQFPANFFWFALGMVIGFHLAAVKHRLVAAKWGLLAACLITYGLALAEWVMLTRLTERPWIAPQTTAMSQLFMLFTLLTYLAFANLTFPFSAQLGEIGSMAFGIYLIHIPVLTVTAKAVYHLIPAALGYLILFQLILVTAGIAIPVLMMKLAGRSPASRYYQYIFG
jgi:peptidoglycan/LPS O-acetylase OafA/YrhL